MSRRHGVGESTVHTACDIRMSVRMEMRGERITGAGARGLLACVARA
jgi:hypothetical protein